MEIVHKVMQPAIRFSREECVDLPPTTYMTREVPLTPEQEQVAKETIADVDASGLWPGAAVTTIEPAGPFWEAEPEHQDYLQRYPNGYNCHYPRAGWVLPRRIQATEASV